MATRVAWWWLDRTQFVASRSHMPYLSHVAISKNGERLIDKRGGEDNEAAGHCCHDPCVHPLIGIPPYVEWVVNGRRSNRRRHARIWRRAVVADMIGYIAGPLAEAIHREDPIEDFWSWQCEVGDRDGGEEGTDSWNVEQREFMTGRRFRLWRDRAFETADHIVRRHEPHITALAEALLDAGRLDGEAVETLLDQRGAPMPTG